MTTAYLITKRDYLYAPGERKRRKAYAKVNGEPPPKFERVTYYRLPQYRESCWTRYQQEACVYPTKEIAERFAPEYAKIVEVQAWARWTVLREWDPNGSKLVLSNKLTAVPEEARSKADAVKDYVAKLHSEIFVRKQLQCEAKELLEVS